jgi:adenine phosphoribosyltransferase
MDFKTYIRDIPNFPKSGIIFRDITPLLQNALAFKKASEVLFQMMPPEVDKVVGVESRGFFFAPILALQLNAGFVPVRKAGKLPADKISETYSLEYGADVLEIHTDSIQKGDRVVVHDDVLATGGTATAVCTLIEKLGGHIVQCNFLIELDFLNGKEKLKPYPIKSLMHY